MIILLVCTGGWAQQTQDVATVTAQVDALFSRWQKAIPPPASLSEANGVSMSTPHGSKTYNQLRGLSAALSKMGPNAIPKLVQWAQSPEPYQRQIAIFALIDLTGQDSGHYAVPGMGTVGHIYYARIMTTVWRYARDQGIPLAARDLPVVVPPEDGKIDPRVFGHWRLVNANSPSQNIFETYAIDSNRFVVTSWKNARGQGPDQIRHTYSHPVARYKDLGDGWVGVYVIGERLDITPPGPGQTEPHIFRHRMDEPLRVAFRLTTPDTMWIDRFARARAGAFRPHGHCFERIEPPVPRTVIKAPSPGTVSRDEKAHATEKVEQDAGGKRD